LRDDRLDILFEPLETKNLRLKNRFFMAPMGTTFSMDRLIPYFVARARGGAALITTGEISVHESGRALGGGPGDRELSLENDGDIGILEPLVRAVRENGARFVAQLNHMGRYSFMPKTTGRQAVAPSAVASRYTGYTPRELTTGEADELVAAFAEAAVRARKAGFDGIEICANSGYLISQFLSAVTNRRTDRYGGDDVIGRAAFLFAVLRETRNRVGRDYDVCVKFDAEDGVEGGKTLEDSLRLAPRIVEAGADRLHVWAGWHEAARPMLPMFVPRGAFAGLAGAVKRVVRVPVSTVGRINDPFTAADILKRGDADLIGLGRALLCDPDFVRKTMEGRTGEIRRCIACCNCFDGISEGLRGHARGGLRCSLNPELGREGDPPRAAAQKRKVVIAGGGPAGLEAARTAALRGHRVVLFEKGAGLGGLIREALLPPHKGELGNIIAYYEAQMAKLGVEVRLNEEFTADRLDALSPDVVVVATGSVALVPGLPGIRGKHVATSLEILRGRVPDGENVVVVGGGMIGLEIAEMLADGGRKVTVVEMLDHVAGDMGPTVRWGFLSRLRKKVSILTSTKVVGIGEDGVDVLGGSGRGEKLPASSVVIAVGLKPLRGLGDSLKCRGVEFHVIGSGLKTGKIADAVSDGYRIGSVL
jgi:2,4-dienoyl-CoA reductase-like NADH-dependent reductase (Old Yellow Enzyme family)/thioredoxin reductase